jgi:putative ABC transport system substrate-binding protein
MAAAMFAACSNTSNTKILLPIRQIPSYRLLYDAGQDSSTSAIAAAKAYLDDKGVAYKEYTGTTVTRLALQ